ncbi:MAG: glutamate--tRNA ligase [Acetobacteraceae bacterium]
MSVRVRFAPSPTGPLHVGNARIALLNFLFARHHGGDFLLRFDDTDRERSRPEHAAAIERDLKWLGLTWQGPEYQSARLPAYAAAAECLQERGRLYACYETEDELQRKRAAQRRLGRPPVYDRAGLRLSPVDRGLLEAAGEKPHWRFLLSGRVVSWHDMVLGERRIPLPSLSDPVLVRADGTPLYTFSSIVDDQEFGITHVIRGEDHVTNTAVQIDLWEALDEAFPLPAFAHLPLLTDETGGKLSKRLGSLGIATLREDGVASGALTGYLARLGTARDVEPAALESLAGDFDLAAFSRSPARFDVHQLLTLNRRVLQHLPFAAVAGALPAGATVEFWLVVRENIDLLSQTRHWWQVVAGEIAPAAVPVDGSFLRDAAALLPPEPWDDGVWKVYSAALTAATGLRGKALFHPLRLALTGEEDGPALARLLPLIGRARAAARLKEAARAQG